MKNRKRIKKGILLIMGILLSFVLTGCRFGMNDVKASVLKPQSTGVSIEGHYVYQDVINLEEGKFVDETNFRNFTAEFDLNGAQIGLEKVDMPRYISKLVNTFDYFLEKYRVNPSRLRITNENMEVVRISTSDRSFYEVFKLDDQNIAVVKGSNLIKLRKAAATADAGGQTEESAKILDFGESDEALPEEDAFFEPIAGVLIGLREDRDEATGLSDYRTLWITNDGEVQEVYEIDDILFPRKEFWKLEVVSDEIEGETKERLNIYAITGTPSSISEKMEYNFPSTSLDVSFVGNNYVSVLASDEETDRDLMDEALTIPVDGYNSYNPVNINELDPKDGAPAFINSLNQVIQRNEELKNVPIAREDILNNFILRRHHGYWMMESRFVTTVDENDTVYKVPIALKPTENIVTYDDLTVPWVKIKESIPQAIDAFNAPGNSFLLVRTPKYLLMYKIEGVDEISREPIQAIEIKEDEEIIMAEWARGEFVKRWTDVASKQGTKIIFVQNRR